MDWNKMKVNNAIYEVITHQYKKECKKSHKTVENAGYEISKYGGDWYIKNPQTGRTILLKRNREMIHFNPYLNSTKLTKQFDFVGCLEKPINFYTVEQRDVWLNGETSNAKKKYDLLKSKEWNINFHNSCIEEAKKSLERAKEEFFKAVERYEKDIARHTKKAVEDKEALENYRKEIGLA